MEGFSSVVGNLGTRLQTEGAVLRSTSFWGPFLLVVLWQSWMVVRNASALNETVTHHRSFIAVLRDHRLALIRIAFIALTAVTAAMWGSAQALVIAMSLAVAAASLVGRLHRPIIALIAYWGGAIFLALVMQAQQDRLALTFSFALYIAIFLSMCDQPRSDARSLRLRTSYGLGAGVALIVVMLYGGVFVFSSEWKSIYHSRVVGRNAALKLSEDRILDRCLHYTGARELIYTRCNDSPVGTVREYAQIEAPLGMWNASYRAPASFLP